MVDPARLTILRMASMGRPCLGRSGPSYQATGGNPGGYITTTDQGLGGMCTGLTRKVSRRPIVALEERIHSTCGRISMDSSSPI